MSHRLAHLFGPYFDQHSDTANPLIPNVSLQIVCVFKGYKSQDKRSKSHKYDNKASRFKKKSKEKENTLRRSRVSNQRQYRSHSDDEEDETVPASYHTVSLQVSHDVSMAGLSSSFIFSLVYCIGQDNGDYLISSANCYLFPLCWDMTFLLINRSVVFKAFVLLFWMGLPLQ